MDKVIVKIGKIVKEKRLIKGYSTQELSELLGVSTGLVSNIENGKTDTFNLKFMAKICNILDISILSILLNESEDIKSLLSVTSNATGKLSNNINEIIDAYIRAAAKLDYDSVKLEKLKDKIIYEVDFMLGFYRCHRVGRMK